MPVKDTAREAAFAAMRAARNDIVRVCREIHDDTESAGDPRRAVERLSVLLTQHGFEFESGNAGRAGAFRATRLRHDSDAMRKGLRHGHVAILVRADAGLEGRSGDGNSIGLAATIGAAIGLGAGLEGEFGAVTVVGYPDDASLVAMVRAGVFDEFDAVLGAKPALSGDGFCYTIEGTGETLASRSTTVSVDGDLASFTAAITAEAATLESPNRIGIVSGVSGVVDLTLTGRTSIELDNLSAIVQRLVEETPGTRVTFSDAFDDTLVSRILARRVKTYANTLGYKMDKIRAHEPGDASGWGSVSHATPTFRLSFPITVDPAVIDATGVSAAATSERYDRALEFAECLCMAGMDVLRDMQFRSIADDQLVKALAKRGVSRQHRRWLGVHPVIKETSANGKNGKKGPKMSGFQMVRGPGMRDN